MIKQERIDQEVGLELARQSLARFDTAISKLGDEKALAEIAALKAEFVLARGILEVSINKLSACFVIELRFAQKGLPYLAEKQLLKILLEAGGKGILQKDLYPLFPDIAYTHICSTLKHYEEAGALVRIQFPNETGHRGPNKGCILTETGKCYARQIVNGIATATLDQKP